MQRVLLIFCFLLNGMCIAQEQKQTDVVDKLSSALKSILQTEVQNRTQRQQVHLDLHVKIDKNHWHFALASRSERDSVFSLQIAHDSAAYRVHGRVLNAQLKKLVEKTLREFFDKRPFYCHLVAGNLGWGIISVPVANLYVQPQKRAGDNLASQLLHGTPVLLLECTTDKAFFRVQGMDDHYIGWLAADAFFMATSDQWHQWRTMPRAYLDKALSDYNLHVGTALGIKNEELWIFPEKQLMNKDIAHLAPVRAHSISRLIQTAKRFLPNGDLGPCTYLWGGTCVPQVDCSGFVQLVFRLNNILLSRDADQQYQYSVRIARQNMQAGDLLFFSKNRRRPTHVGIYLGQQAYIHSSTSGAYSGVKINYLNGNKDYERYLHKIYYGAGRVFPEED